MVTFPSVIVTMLFNADINDRLNILHPHCDKSKALMRMISNKRHFLPNDLIEIRNIGFSFYIIDKNVNGDIFLEGHAKVVEDMLLVFEMAKGMFLEDKAKGELTSVDTDGRNISDLIMCAQSNASMLFKTATVSGFNVLSPACDRSEALLRFIPNKTNLTPHDLLNVEGMGLKWSVIGEVKHIKRFEKEMETIRESI